MASETNTTVTTLDHIDKITVSGNVFDEPANEYYALVCLRHGMELLYRQARQCDQVVKQKVNPNGNRIYSGFGDMPGIDQIPQTLLTCAFHWYAISVCQYVRTVGAIACKQDSAHPLPLNYAQKIIPEVISFRDKVAGHFAWSTKNSQDNDAERLASIMPQLAFHNDSFYVSSWAVHVQVSGKKSDSQALKPWSLCKVHEALRERYWPDQQTDNGRP